MYVHVCMSRSGLSRFRNPEFVQDYHASGIRNWVWLHIRLMFNTSKLIYYWHNYAENKSYAVAGEASLGCSCLI